MIELLIAVIPALIAFLGAIWKSTSDLKKQKLIHETRLSEIKEEAARERERERDRLEAKLREMKAETDEELRKADAKQSREFLEHFMDPTRMGEQFENLATAAEKAADLEKKMQSRKGWRR